MIKSAAIALTILLLGLALFVALALTFLKTRRNEPERQYWRDILAVGGFALLVGCFFWRPIFESGVFVPMGGGDLASFHYPMFVFASNSLHNGDFPIWNPYLFGGMPYAADIQSALFYPLNPIFMLFGYPVSYPKVELLAILHYWLAGSFTFAFLRSLNLQRWPAFIGGLIFAFSGFAVVQLGHLPMLETANWFPLILLAANQAAKRRSLAWAIATGLLLAIDFLAGHFQLFIYVTYAMLGWWLALAWYFRPQTTENLTNKSKNLWAKLGWNRLNIQWQWWVSQFVLLAISFVVLLGGTLVQLWPFYEMGNQSIRSAISYETSTQFGVWPIGLIELLLPNLFGSNPTNYYGAWSNTEVLGYLGLFSYALAALGLLLSRQPRIYKIFFGALTLLGLLFSLSGFTVLQGWLYEFIPALHLMRASGRFLLWFDFGGAVAAALGAQALFNWLAEPPELVLPTVRQTLKWAWRGLGLFALGLIFLPLPLLYNNILSNPGNNNDLLIRGINGLVLVVIILLLGAWLLWSIYQRQLKTNAAASLIVALLVFDLFSARVDFNPTTQDVTAAFDNGPIANYLHQQDPQNLYRIDSTGSSAVQVWQPDTADIYDLTDVQGLFNPLQLANYDALWNAVVKQGKDFRSSPAYALFNVGYVIARNKEDPLSPQFQTVFKDTRPGINLNVDKNTQALPRAWIVHQAIVSSSQSEILKDVLSPDFKPSQTVYLANGKTLNGSATTAAETVRIVSQGNNSLELDANLQSEGYVVLSQAYYPGWQVQIDDTQGKLLNADYAFGAILLPPGHHTIQLSFAPPSFVAGAIVSGFVWLLALAFLAFRLIQHLGKNGNKNQKYSQESETLVVDSVVR